MKNFYKLRPAAITSQMRPPDVFQDSFCFRTLFHSGYDVTLPFNSLTILLAYCTGMEGTDYLLTYLLSYLLSYLLTPWSRVLLEKLTGSAASQEIPRIFGTRKFITVLTSARHLSLS